MYKAFNPMELEIIGAFIKGYACMEVPKREEGIDRKIKITGTQIVRFPLTTNEFDLVRPYTPLERFIEAVKFLAVTKKIRFENAIFHVNNNKIEAIGTFDPKRQAESKRIYDRIIGWDENYLDSLVEKRKGILEGQLKLNPSPAPPLTISASISDLEQMAKAAGQSIEASEPEADSLTFTEGEPTFSEAQPITKKRGRPAKVS